MPLLGGGTTRIKRGQRIWPNHTPGSMSIRWATVHFGVMGSPNIYVLEAIRHWPYGALGEIRVLLDKVSKSHYRRVLLPTSHAVLAY
jgi:hypothetical protein